MTTLRSSRYTLVYNSGPRKVLSVTSFNGELDLSRYSFCRIYIIVLSIRVIFYKGKSRGRFSNS